MGRPTLRRASALLCVLACFLGVPRTAAAQSAPAQALFDEGRALMAAEKWPEAARKLEESLRLERAPGTAFNLGECFEKTGRTASAWAAFLEVAALSRAANRLDREQIARERAKALEPKLTRIIIAVPPASRVAGLSVTRNGEIIGEGQWDTPLPVDPGELLIRATSPGKIPWDARLTTAGEGKTVTAEVPLLEQDVRVGPPVVAPPPPPPPPAAGTASQSAPLHSRQRAAAVGVAGAGLLAVGVASYFGLHALSKKSDSNAGPCRNDNKCTTEGLTLRDEARTAGTVSTILFGLGAAALVGGSVLWFTAPTSPSSGAAGGVSGTF